MKKSLSTEKFNVLYFDGVCNLCNHWVDFLISRDKQRKLKFSSLQGESAKALPREFTDHIHSFVFIKDGKLYSESTAAILAISELGGTWTLLKLLLIVPRFIRNAVYRFVARNRYKWFGQRETCRLPSAAERAQFLP